MRRRGIRKHIGGDRRDEGKGDPNGDGPPSGNGHPRVWWPDVIEGHGAKRRPRDRHRKGAELWRRRREGKPKGPQRDGSGGLWREVRGNVKDREK